MLKSNHSRLRFILLLLIVLLTVQVTMAQDDNAESTPEPEPIFPEPTMVVEIDADDGSSLYGDYYASRNGVGPAVILLHELYTDRASWGWMLEPLLANGYHVLSVDLRGWGDSRVPANWRRAQTDTVTWFEWLYNQPAVLDNQIFAVGSSMGANLAMVGCANAELCAGVVALSPGLNYFGVRASDALVSGRQMLVVYADRDSIPRRDVPRMETLLEEAELTDLFTFLVYEGRAHGILLFDDNEDLIPQIIAWMNAQL